jgi:hypothetical protein
MRIWIPRWASALMLDESDSRPRFRDQAATRNLWLRAAAALAITFATEAKWRQ